VSTETAIHVLGKVSSIKIYCIGDNIKIRVLSILLGVRISLRAFISPGIAAHVLFWDLEPFHFWGRVSLHMEGDKSCLPLIHMVLVHR
jgi:hypothetical protein